MFLHMLKKRKHKPPRSGLRKLLLLLVFMGVIWAFWENTQRQINQLSSHLNIWEDPQVLTENEKTALQDMISEFKSKYGIDVRMEILEAPLHKPINGTPLIYLGLNPRTGEALVSIPSWLRLEPGFDNYVENTYILPRLPEKEYAYALADALRAIWDELGKMDKNE